MTSDKDHLRELLQGVDYVNKPIDLENVILKTIEERQVRKEKIKNYRKKGFFGFVLSILLIVTLVGIFSIPSSIQSIEYTMIKYTSLGIALFILFLQLETGGIKFINQFKTKHYETT